MKLLKISALALSMSFGFASCSDMNMDDLLKKMPDKTEQPMDNNGGGNTGGGNDGGNTGGGSDDGTTGGGTDDNTTDSGTDESTTDGGNDY